LEVFHYVLGGPSTFAANMYNQVFQARTPIILVCVDVSPVQGEPDEPRGVMRGQRRRVYVLVYVGRSISMRAHLKHMPAGSSIILAYCHREHPAHYRRYQAPRGLRHMVPRCLKMHNTGCHHVRAWWKPVPPAFAAPTLFSSIALFVDGVGGCVQVMTLPCCDGCDTYVPAAHFKRL
jgi:hypothetical protein